MKKHTVSILIMAVALVFMAGCAEGGENTGTQTQMVESDSQDYGDADTDITELNAEIPDMDGISAAAFDWLPTGVEQKKSETEPNEELSRLIIEYFEIPDDELANTRYYYNYVDLDGNGKNEIFTVVVGSYTSGSGGSSALWCEEQDGALAVKQELTLINMPVIVADNEENGPKSLILERSGGGAETEYVELICEDGVYTNVSDAEPAAGLEDISGVAILCNDLADDMQTGNYLTLE